MSKISLSLVLFLIFSLLNQALVYASATQEFIYKSDKIEFSLIINAGFREADSVIIEETKKYLPYILALERKVDHPIRIFIGCQHMHVANLEIGDKKVFSVNCDNSTVPEVIQKIFNNIGRKSETVAVFEGFTIEVVHVPKGTKPDQAEESFFNKRFELVDAAMEYSSMQIGGDLYMSPIWINSYDDGSHGICFGIFKEYNKASEAVKVLKLDKNYQIMPIKFNVKDIGKYFDYH